MLKNSEDVPQKRHTVDWTDLSNPSTRMFVHMVGERITYQSIGDVFGITRWAVERAILKMIACHGHVVFGESLFTTWEVARSIGVKPKLVLSLCRTGEVPCRYVLRSRRHLMTTDDVRVLTKYVKSKCNQAQWRTDKKTRGQQKHVPTGNNGNGLLGEPWHEEFSEKLLRYTPSCEERWVTVSRAAACTGLSNEQILQLERLGLVITRPHPTQELAGKPIQTYELGQLRLAKQVCMAYELQTKSRDHA